MTSTLDPERLAALRAGKLAALATTVAAPGTPTDHRPGTFPGGAALVRGSAAWVLVGERPERSLGPALAWARQAGAASLDVVVDGPDPTGVAGVAGVLARRALPFAAPPRVWTVQGRELRPAEPAPVEVDAPLDPRLAPFADLLTRAGADPVVEHGRLVGEVAGLEVARVEVVEGEPRLEIGVGRFDREAHALVSRDRPSADALADVVALVRRHRRPDAPAHPLKRLAAARWLRARVVARPALVGGDHLAPVAAPMEAPDLRTPWPAGASGTDLEGRPLVVVCSTGIDLDLVPMAADLRRADGRDARLVLAVPARDDHPVTRALAAALAQPAEVVTVAEERTGPAGPA